MRSMDMDTHDPHLQCQRKQGLGNITEVKSNSNEKGTILVKAELQQSHRKCQGDNCGIYSYHLQRDTTNNLFSIKFPFKPNKKISSSSAFRTSLVRLPQLFGTLNSKNIKHIKAFISHFIIKARVY